VSHVPYEERGWKINYWLQQMSRYAQQDFHKLQFIAIICDSTFLTLMVNLSSTPEAMIADSKMISDAEMTEFCKDEDLNVSNLM
jgi:hypothetical protein